MTLQQEGSRGPCLRQHKPSTIKRKGKGHAKVHRMVAAALSITPAQAPTAQEQKVPLEQQKVSRLPPLPQPLDPILREMFDKRRAQGGAIINPQLTTGHAPNFARAASAIAFTIRLDAKTPRRLLELTIMRAAQIAGSNYEINQHLALIRMCGYSDAQIATLPTWRTSTLFDARERAVLDYVEQVAHGGDVDERHHLRRLAEIFHAAADCRTYVYCRQLLRQRATHQGAADRGRDRRPRIGAGPMLTVAVFAVATVLALCWRNALKQYRATLDAPMRGRQKGPAATARRNFRPAFGAGRFQGGGSSRGEVAHEARPMTGSAKSSAS
jgi:alkylhydroperoxidase family enzyme